MKEYKIEIKLKIEDSWDGVEPSNWNWQQLLCIGNGIELNEVRISEGDGEKVYKSNGKGELKEIKKKLED